MRLSTSAPRLLTLNPICGSAPTVHTCGGVGSGLMGRCHRARQSSGSAIHSGVGVTLLPLP